MTEEENRELKKNQHKLSKNLQQLEKITARVKQLVGLADKSFKKKWDELEKTDIGKSEFAGAESAEGGEHDPVLFSVEEDLKAGGDTADMHDYERSGEKPSPRAEEPEEKAEAEKEAETASIPSAAKEEAKPKSNLVAQCSEGSGRDTPRTRLRNDLKKLNEDLGADLEDSEMDTTDEMETPTSSQNESVPEMERSRTPKTETPTPRNEQPLRLLLPSESLETKMSKILTCDAKPLSKVQSISAMESIAGLKTPSLPSVDSDTKSVPVSVQVHFFFPF